MNKNLLCLTVCLIPFLSGWCLADNKPNILFILSDNQSYYEMSCHGHETVKTPNIDRLASQSMDFQNFHAPPYCSPSRSVILTGQYAMRSGVHDTIGGRSIMHRRQKTLANILQENGYTTGIFGKWHLGFSYPHGPKHRGFDEAFVHGGGGVGQMEDYYGNSLFDTTFIHNHKPVTRSGYCTDALFDQACNWIEANQSKPFFAFIATPVTHSPHHGPKNLVAQLKQQGVEGNVELFAQIQNLDTNIGKVLNKVKELELDKKTIVIYASDQGMNDRGAPQGPNRLGNQYDPAHHVPFMIRAKGIVPGINRRLAGMLDFYPTMLDLCDIRIPKNVDGVSLKPLLYDRVGYPEDRTLIVQCPRGRKAEKWIRSNVKTERWRLVDGQKLFDIQADPRMQNDVAPENANVVAKLRESYEAFWSSLPQPSETLTRHPLGEPGCQETVLNGMDWYTGSRPWHQGHFKKPGNGAWPITVVQSGRYQIDAYHFPREAQKAMNKTLAKIQIGEQVKELKLSPQDNFARFELELKKGDFDLQTWLSREEKSTGALFVYIRKIAADNSEQDEPKQIIYEGPKDKLNIYLLIGQSNMAGRAPFDSSEGGPIARTYLLDDNGKFIQASNPLNRFSTIRKGLGMQKMNPGFGFATKMTSMLKEESVGLIVNAKGGSRIEEWSREKKFYKEAVARTQMAMKIGELKGILWHQGEGNSKEPEKYLPQLKTLIENFRKDLAQPNLPFVAGQIVGNEKINEVIATLPQKVPYTGFVSSEGLKAFDRWHFDTPSMKLLGERYAVQMNRILSGASPNPILPDALATRKNFVFAKQNAFVMMPPKVDKSTPVPWVWYAPTLGKNLPGSAEKWMFDRFHKNGIAIAGIDVGESYGSPDGRKTYEQFHAHLVKEFNFSTKPVLLARSRGGLMLYSWACDHPDSVGGIAGIYPVCNIASYPGVARAAGAYKLTAKELESRLKEFNPIHRLQGLAKAKVPVFHIHGDSDKVVPLEANSSLVEKAYRQLQGPVEIEVVKGQGHNMWTGWFTSEKLLKFVLNNAR